jgi:hypothetical protein
MWYHHILAGIRVLYHHILAGLQVFHPAMVTRLYHPILAGHHHYHRYHLTLLGLQFHHQSHLTLAGHPCPYPAVFHPDQADVHSLHQVAVVADTPHQAEVAVLHTLMVLPENLNGDTNRI